MYDLELKLQALTEENFIRYISENSNRGNTDEWFIPFLKKIGKVEGVDFEVVNWQKISEESAHFGQNIIEYLIRD